jgi:hypothetical protein
MLRYATAAVLAVLASVPLASAAEKAPKPTGEWTRTVGDFTITFKFEHHTMRMTATKNNGETLEVDTAYGMTEDGLVFGVLTKVDKKGTDEGPEKGDLFSFHCKIDKDVLTISDLTGSRPISDDAKQLVAGDYTKKK